MQLTSFLKPIQRLLKGSIAPTGEAKFMSLEAFKDLVNQKNWKREEKIDLLGVHVPYFLGESRKTSRLEGISIHYTERFSYSEIDVLGTLHRTTEDVETVWSLEGVSVVDGNRVLAIEELSGLLGEDFSLVDYDWLIVGSA